VVGMVLVDASHHDQQARGLAVLPPPEPDEPVAVRNMRQWLSGPDTLNSEGVNIRESQEQLRGCVSVGNIPLVVISRSRHVDWPGFPPIISAAMEQAWHDMQQDLTTLSPQARWLIAGESGHYIQRDQPQLVVDAIMDVVRSR
jgi:pimeloyl-ACP methyl ester carboxylesterase